MASPLSENEHFISLVRLCQEDKEMRATIFKLLDLPDFQRSSVLGMVTHEMSIKGIEPQLIDAVTALKDPAIASKTREILRKEIG